MGVIMHIVKHNPNQQHDCSYGFTQHDHSSDKELHFAGVTCAALIMQTSLTSK